MAIGTAGALEDPLGGDFMPGYCRTMALIELLQIRHGQGRCQPVNSIREVQRVLARNAPKPFSLDLKPLSVVGGIVVFPREKRKERA
jgi:hypothetical protein